MNRNDPKTGRYTRAAYALLSEPTASKAATKAGISRATMVRYQRDARFQAILRELADEVYAESSSLLRGAVREAITVLIQAMRSGKALPWSKIHAASRVWELAHHSRDLDVADQLDMLANSIRVLQAEQARIDQERATGRAWPGSTAQS